VSIQARERKKRKTTNGPEKWSNREVLDAGTAR
jgi:hypothetical protein